MPEINLGAPGEGGIPTFDSSGTNVGGMSSLDALGMGNSVHLAPPGAGIEPVFDWKGSWIGDTPVATGALDGCYFALALIIAAVVFTAIAYALYFLYYLTHKGSSMHNSLVV